MLVECSFIDIESIKGYAEPDTINRQNILKSLQIKHRNLFSETEVNKKIDIR